MNAIVLLPTGAHPTPRAGSPLITVAPPANDERQLWAGFDCPAESPLDVSYVGLTIEEQARALASFPGARRCALAGA